MAKSSPELEMGGTKYEILMTASFRKALKKMQKRGKNTALLAKVVKKLANDEALEVKYKNHCLRGNYEGYEECHLEPDWLLIYKRKKEKLVLVLLETGSHSDLFGK